MLCFSGLYLFGPTARFNRIYVEVLSVIAQQLLELFGAKASLSSFAECTQLTGPTSDWESTRQRRIHEFWEHSLQYACIIFLGSKIQLFLRSFTCWVPEGSRSSSSRARPS